MAVREGLQSIKKEVTVLKSRGGITKMRCRYDNSNTILVPDGKGGMKQQCPTCKRTYITKSM